MAFVWKNDQLRWHALPLQRIEEFQGLGVRHTKVQFAVNHEGRRFEFRQLRRVGRGSPLVVAFRIRPWRALHVVFFEPKLFRGVHRIQIVNAGMADNRLESARVRGNPVRQVAAVRSSRSRHARPIRVRIFLQNIIHTVHYVDECLAAPIAGDLVREFLPVAR